MSPCRMAMLNFSHIRLLPVRTKGQQAFTQLYRDYNKQTIIRIPINQPA